MTDTSTPDFNKEIEAHKSAETAPAEIVTISSEHSSLGVRLRGCFVTDFELTDPTTGKIVNVLHSDPDLTASKLTASHVMMPVSKTEGVGGQHGYPRWADYHEFEQLDGENGEKIVSFQAKRSDYGLGLAKVFEFTDDRLTTHTIATNYLSESAPTSIGEHLYFDLPDEDTTGLKVNGKTLDELLGEGAEVDIMSGKSQIFESFDGEVVIDFPAGHRILLSAETDQSDSLKMIIWHRPGNDSICFEPTAGFDRETGNEGLLIGPEQTATLTTNIELIPACAL